MSRPEWLGGAELAILGLSLLLRLAVIHGAVWQPVHDTRDYHVLAWNLAHGHGYQQLYLGETPEYRGLTFHAYRMPGYPAVLALLYTALGWSARHAYRANVAFELVTQLGVLWGARRLFGRPVALVAQALFGLHVLWTPVLMTESLFTLLYTGLALAGLTSAPARSAAHAAGVGALLAGATFVRPIALSVVPLFLVQVGRIRPVRRAGLIAILLILPLAGAVTGWTARNLRVLGAPVWLSTNLGPHNARAFGIDRTAVVLDLRAHGVTSEVAINRALLGRIRERVVQAPLGAVGLYLRRIGELLTPKRSRGIVERYEGALVPAWLFQALALQYFLTYALAFVGVVILAWRGPPAPRLWALLGGFVGLHAVVSNGSLRFAAPLYPLLCILAAHGAVSIWRACGIRGGGPPGLEP
jgi:hypothetical protein